MSTRGWPLLLRLAVHRDRLPMLLGVGFLTLLSLASAAATPSLYPDRAAAVRAAEALNASPAIVALYGPVLQTDSIGELAMTKMTVLYAVLVAALAVALVRRHTRVEEETGRAELVGASAVGRYAPTLALVVQVLGVALLLGAATALGNTLAGLDATGSVAFGALWAGTGLWAAGVAAVAAQLSASARTCAGWAAGSLGAAFVLRAVGDTGPRWLSWLSPFGWNTQVQAYGETRWWLLAAYPALAVLLGVLAAALRSRRDLGSGVLPARPGPPVASPRLAGAGGLALRLHATTLALWTAAAGALGVLFGMITPGVGDLLDSEAARSVLESLGGALVAAVLSVLSVVLTYFAVVVVVHAAHDEAEGRTELVLATGVSRGRWFLSVAGLALGGTAWLLLVTGCGMWLGYDVAGGPEIGNLVVAAVAWLPATWLVTALAVLSLALGRRVAGLAWVWPAGFVTVSVLADTLRLPGWVGDLSPYAHVPSVPAEPWSWTVSGTLTAGAVVVLALAWWRLRARDIG
ncbi:ABC transporter permease [Nocardioides sp. zg-ZUI104]|uniref:ABC transporter permease n=1 Tax=Nocardioides faecalis TaxID=2803858 RepID=UPI001BCF0B64|nr:ABC transporter permease [Nocardioides faecalis]MBS4753921.1 ABC transporter permease [Nocardioides faecalis]